MPGAPSLALRWQHGNAAAATDSTHARWHDAGVVHRHAVTDVSVWTSADEAANDAIGHLASVLAAGTAVHGLSHIDAAHVRGDARPWSATTRSIPPPLRPPRV